MTKKWVGFNLTRSESDHGRVYIMMRLLSKVVVDDHSKSWWSEENFKWWWQWQEWFWGVMGRLEGRVPRHQTALLSQASCKQFKFKSQKHDYDKDEDDVPRLLIDCCDWNLMANYTAEVGFSRAQKIPLILLSGNYLLICNKKMLLLCVLP